MNRNSTLASHEPSRGAMVALETILPKLEEVLIEENKILESQTVRSHDEFILKKNYLLRDLMAVQRMERLDSMPQEMKRRLTAVRSLVEKNRHLLGAQIAAMTEITSMLTSVALAEEADGTYSRRQ